MADDLATLTGQVSNELKKAQLLALQRVTAAIETNAANPAHEWVRVYATLAAPGGHQ
jgi:hypothetical protein